MLDGRRVERQTSNRKKGVKKNQAIAVGKVEPWTWRTDGSVACFSHENRGRTQAAHNRRIKG